MHLSVYIFVINVLRGLRGRCIKLLEVGSYNVNGSVRDWIIGNLCVDYYVGIDLSAQRGYVDVIADAHNLPFRDGAFDLVISTEVLEHVREWHAVVEGMKRVLKPYGMLVVTTRGPGFPLHGYPYDYWRYRVEDFREIFNDMAIYRLIEDFEAPGVFFAGIKRTDIQTPRVSVLSVFQTLPHRQASTDIILIIKRFAFLLKVFIMDIFARFSRPERLKLRYMAEISNSCIQGRSIAICGGNTYYVGLSDMLYYFKSLAKGSESRDEFSRAWACAASRSAMIICYIKKAILKLRTMIP